MRTVLQFVRVAVDSRGEYINETIAGLFISFENINSKVPLGIIESEIKSSVNSNNEQERERTKVPLKDIFENSVFI